MREAAFIQRNKQRWHQLEQVVDGLERLSADDVSELYVQLTDDLSYARTFYPDSNVQHFLNGLAARTHQYIHRNQRTPRGRFVRFWKEEVPLAMAATRAPLALSAGIFLAAVLVGALSARHDPTFVRLILGDDYVNMTLQNIREGKPMAVYGSSGEGLMFLGITVNNVRVALLAFAAGIAAGFGTVYVLLFNGIMVGAFQYFFHEQGVLRESLLTIWVHGTLEISAIVIAGAAGLALGRGMLFPGTYTRMESFRRGAMLGLKVVIGLVPVFVVAGFLESFVTRHALSVPSFVSASIIVLSLAFLIGYFILLPRHVQLRSSEAGTGP